jgi:peptidoglycan/LPS O-acetylase OafA/YrhL
MLPPAADQSSLVPQLPSRIPSLDGLRAVSILMVIVAHAIDPVALPLAYSLLGHIGNYGVRIFFLISGFLITTLLLKEAARHGSIPLLAFYAPRTIRIFPTFYCYIFTVILLASLGYIVLKPGDILHTLTYTMNFHQDRAWYLNQTWSLSVEEQFYLLWPALMLWLGPRRAMSSALLLVLAAPVIRAIMHFGFAATPTALGRHFYAVADALACGCLLAGVYNRLSNLHWYRRIQSHLLYLALPLLLIAASGICYKVSQPLYYILGQSIANAGCFLLLDYAVRESTSPAGRLLNTAPMAYIRALS